MKSFAEIRTKYNCCITVDEEVIKATDYITETIYANISEYANGYCIKAEHIFRYNTLTDNHSFMKRVIASILSLGAKTASYFDNDTYLTIMF